MKRREPKIITALFILYLLDTQSVLAEPPVSDGQNAVGLSFTGTYSASGCAIQVPALVDIPLISRDILLNINKGAISGNYPFSITVTDCGTLQSSTGNLDISFSSTGELNSGYPAFLNQLQNDKVDIAQGIGFSITDARPQGENVLNSDGTPQMLHYSVDDTHPLTQVRDFRVGYIKIAEAITSGYIESTVIINATYN